MAKNNSPIKMYINELNLELLQPNTKTYMDPDQGGSKHVVIGKPGCFAAGTKVLMHDGSIKTIENIKIGEKVMGDDSKPRNVLELCHNTDEMYKIIPKSGEEYIVNKKHKLVLKSCGYHKIQKGEIIEIPVDDFLAKPQGWQDRWAIYRTGVDFPERAIEIDPYMLGIWLGDGTSSNTCVTNIDEEIIKYMDEFAIENNLINQKSTTAKYRYTIRSVEGTKGKNAFLNFLKSNDLINNKHIPSDYNINSRENRLSLLAGIIDSDGYYNVKGNGYEITQKSDQLTNDIVYLCRSLGFAISNNKCIKSCTYKGKKVEGLYNRMFIRGNIEEVPCKVFRKQAKPRKCNRDWLVSRFSIEKLEVGEYYGFTLDGNHRFLLATFDVVRNTGKSTLIAALLYAKKHIYPCGIVFSGTEDSNGFYKKKFPDTFVFNKYDEEQLRSFIKRQKIAKKHVENPWAVCLLDDCTDNPSIFNKPLQQGIYKNSRHWKMWYILSLQYCMDVKPVIRTNVDGTFILREPNLKNRKSLWENYAGIIPDFAQFCEIMDQITDDYTALYIHNATKSNKLEDCLFWFKAKPVPEGFKFGCPDFWEFHYSRFNTSYVEPFLP